MDTVEIMSANGVKLKVDWEEICRVYDRHRSMASIDHLLAKTDCAKHKLEKISGELVHDQASAVSALYHSGKLSYSDCVGICALAEYIFGCMMLERENKSTARTKQHDRAGA